jgi:hypothetical protein
MTTTSISPRIAFLVGGRRTGSTLLHNLLCRSPDTHRYIGEFQFLAKILDAFSWGHDILIAWSGSIFAIQITL